ncbi:MerR family DNA-binding transcriptional regulator [Conexibacter woesei]|uniref:Transcriptional regulator, MerR family n=1 Tax=Conexibacter woesei (strain DSM 14684 / CCUG 47730 / CIP 108061 / JCM 11494 / NBRC 100937 / ID131577) TaxID=469383 RepID=D3EYS8_CONWI|nr:MerR family transcriptional regulator [Conexibacter woesei]ADB49802.1 transcriptional regulator, MerR family [Conexibacter woesei DSM 14684]
MEHLKVREAAKRLNVSPSTLRAWEQRFGFPRPDRSPGGHRLYRHADIVALRDALEQGLSISSAISRVRRGDTWDAASLVGPLCAFDPDRAARVAEGALAVRSLERAVDEVLLPALADVGARHGDDSAEWAFAAGWVADWLRWTRRLATQDARPIRLLVGDATAHELDVDAVHLHALQLFCTRAGAQCLTVPVRVTRGLASAVHAFAPSLIVLAGDGAADDDVARFAYVARAAVPRPIALYRRRTRSRSPAAYPLAPSPLAAHRQLLQLARGEQPEPWPAPARGELPPAVGG